jgi:SAM-dependent methyltransferase
MAVTKVCQISGDLDSAALYALSNIANFLRVASPNPELSSIHFAKLDIRKLPVGSFDIVTANAILYGFDEEPFAESIRSIAKSLRPGGHLIAFDFFHPFEQEVSIVEKSKAFPDGHPLHFRSYAKASEVLKAAGFSDINYQLFEIKIDLPHPGYGSVVSYTRMSEGQRLLFRGSIFQPWCHLVARRG